MDSGQERGITLYELGRYKEALKYLSENAGSFISRYYMMHCLYHLEEYAQSKEIADEILSEDPNNADVFFIKARIASNQDQDSEALQYIEEAISLNPEEADYFGFKGALLFDKKKYETALDFVNQGLSLAPKNTYCLNLRAQILTKLDRKDEAGETLSDILLENPEDTFSHANVGWVALEHNNPKKAMEHFRMALILDPNSDYAKSGMSTALKAKNFLYRWHLKYAFWIAKQSGKKQWIFIIGIYLAYRISVKLLGDAGLSIIAVPLIVAYLVFALGGWLIDPLSNAILSFDRNGKFLLDKDEKLSGILISSLALLGFLAGLGWYSMGIPFFATLGVASLCAMVPLPNAFVRSGKTSRYFALIYGVVLLLVGILGLLVVPDMGTIVIALIFMLVGFTWLDNLVK